MEGLDALMDKRDLPLRVKTILLPFKGKIVYDGFFRWYNIFFGGGIKSSLKQSYLIAKDNNAIIDTLAPDAFPAKTKGKKVSKQSAAQDWGPLLDELAEKSKKLRGGADSPLPIALFLPGAYQH